MQKCGMNKTSKSKVRKMFRSPSKAKQEREEENRRLRSEAFGRPVDIISRMEANQARFPSLLQSAEDDRREHENDLRQESLMADESEHGPRCNLPNDEAWRQ